MNGIPAKGKNEEAAPGPSGKRGAGLPPSARLRRHSDIKRVYQDGQRHFSRHLSLFFLRRAAGGGSGLRLGVTVGRALGGAVERNRIKRRLREAVRLHRQELQAPLDVLISPKRSVVKMRFSELSAEVRRALQAIISSARGEAS